MSQVWLVDEVPEFWAARTPFLTRERTPDEQLVAEAQRAVRDFRDQKRSSAKPTALTREMFLKAWNHVYEPQPLLLHPDEYAKMMEARQGLPMNRYQFTRELVVPVEDVDPYIAQSHHYMERVKRHRWIPWYDPSSRPHFVITRLDE